MTKYPRFCPICGNPCYGRRYCKDCMTNKFKRYYHKELKHKEKQIER